MKSTQPSSEIILNPDESIYHLGLRPEHLTDIVLTVGDPERVPEVSKYFDTIDVSISKREFVTHIGKLGKQAIMVMSSGMGTDNVEILLTELDILANVNLDTFLPNPEHRSLKIIRIGTTGSLQKDIPLDAMLLSDFAFGVDTLMHFYDLPLDEKLEDYSKALQEQLQLSFLPYCAQGAAALKALFQQEMRIGNTLTCPGFYAPQGRKIRLPIKPVELHEKLRGFSFEGRKITNFEMETAGYYALGRALGHQMLSTNAVVANRVTQTFSKQASKTIDQLIRSVLSKISDLE